MSENISPAQTVTDALTRVLTVAQTVARHHGWCTGWYEYLAGLSVAYAVTGDRYSPHTVAIQPERLAGITFPPGFDYQADLSDAGREKWLSRLNDAANAELVHVRNRIARLAEGGNLAVSDANLAIEAISSDRDAFPLLTVNAAGKVVYVPLFTFQTAEGTKHRNATYTERINAALDTWFATNPVEGAVNLRRGGSVETENGHETVEYGTTEARVRNPIQSAS